MEIRKIYRSSRKSLTRQVLSALATCLFVVLMVSSYGVAAQDSISLTACYELARDNYPLLKKSELLDKAHRIDLDQLQKTRLPQITWEGTTSLQSEAIKVPIMIPGQEIDISVPLYNVQTYLKANYSIYDGGRLKATEAVKTSQLAVDKYAIELDLFRLNKQVNEAFFGVLLMRAQDSLLANSVKDLGSKLEILEAGERNGVILPSEVSKLKVQVLKLEANREALIGAQKSLLALLNALTGKTLQTTTAFILPVLPDTDFNEPGDRPELTYFDLQKQNIESRSAMIDIPYKPQVQAFVQTGIGYPNPLNFFESKLSPFAIGGVQFRWNLLDYGKRKKDREYLAIQSLIVDNQKETFEYNLNLMDGKYREDIERIDALIEKDKAVKTLQEEILEQIASQLKHGVIQVNDYLTEVNASLQSQLNLELHQLQRQQILVDYFTEKGITK